MKGSLRRALALLVAIMMVSTCMPLTALAEIIEASGSVQPVPCDTTGSGRIRYLRVL